MEIYNLASNQPAGKDDDEEEEPEEGNTGSFPQAKKGQQRSENRNTQGIQLTKGQASTPKKKKKCCK